MEALVKQLLKDFPAFSFVASDIAHWSPKEQRVFYCDDEAEHNKWSLLHELGHALKGHNSYTSDVLLLKKEVEAWEVAISIAESYNLSIDPRHIEACLDTYRDWLFKRSTCPTCKNHGIQHSKAMYGCFNCGSTWKVGNNRFCRPYRLKIAQNT